MPFPGRQDTSFLRRISTGRLLAICAGAIGACIATAALALAVTAGGPKPPPSTLPAAIHGALAAPPVEGITARIQFTNDLVASSSLQGSDPLLTGGSGRLWASHGKLRLELQSDGGTGDSQIVIDGRRLLVYSGDTRTAYRGTLPRPAGERGSTREGRVPSVARIRRALGELARHLDVSGATPTDVAGRPAYSVRVAPRRHGGLVGRAELAWDALNGTPLRAAVYARGDGSPVLELRVTDVSFGPVSDSVFAITPPPGTRVTNLGSLAGGRMAAGRHAPVTGLSDVRKRVGFRVAAPPSLAGMPRSEVRLIESNGPNGALVTFGRGLGGIAVLELPTPGHRQGDRGSAKGAPSDLKLPTVPINGAPATELQTPLGTVVHFAHGGVEYTVAGSVPTGVVEDAARGL